MYKANLPYILCHNIYIFLNKNLTPRVSTKKFRENVYSRKGGQNGEEEGGGKGQWGAGRQEVGGGQVGGGRREGAEKGSRG